MHRTKISSFVKGLLMMALVLPALAWAGSTGAQASDAGAVYTLTNSAAGNSVAVFDRAADGTLTAAGTFATGGVGTGAGLGSQGALVLNESNRWLFAVNAGSNEVSAFRVGPGGLTLADKVASGGVRPISLTVHGNWLYVLNGGGTGNITGFSIAQDGTLSPLAGSTRPLSNGAAGPAQVQFSPSGNLLVVTEKANNLIDTYTVGNDGLANGPTTHASSGATPFGFAFDGRANLIVTEAFGGAANASALSSYNVGRDGSLNVVSGSVGTHQTAACWAVVTRNGRYAYTANTGSGSISGYSVGRDGSLSLLNADGRTGVTGDGTTPIDVTVSSNSRYLYQLGAGAHAIFGFQVQSDGSLMPIAGAGGLPAGTIGLAAR